MSKYMILLPNGYEEIEALTVVDFLRRASIEIDMVSITGNIQTVGDHGIEVKADILFEDVNPNDYEGVITPGGMPGTMMLRDDDRVINLIKKFYEDGKLVASICASPLVLHRAGILKNVAGTMYRGMESQVEFGEFREDLAVTSDNVITSRGPATATVFAFEIIKYILGEEASDKIKKDTLFDLLK